jgi:hypothetical protein
MIEMVPSKEGKSTLKKVITQNGLHHLVFQRTADRDTRTSDHDLVPFNGIYLWNRNNERLVDF